MTDLPLIRCGCGWRYRRRCPNPLHWPRVDPRRLSLEVVADLKRIVERYRAAGAPYGETTADMLRWQEDQPGGSSAA